MNKDNELFWSECDFRDKIAIAKDDIVKVKQLEQEQIAAEATTNERCDEVDLGESLKKRWRTE
jgi:hypothetical protein